MHEIVKCLLWGTTLGLSALAIAICLMFTHWAGEQEPIRPAEAVLLWPMLPLLDMKESTPKVSLLLLVTLQALGYTVLVCLVRLARRWLSRGRPGKPDAPEREQLG